MVTQTVRIKVGCKTYNASNSWNTLFLCGSEEVRVLTALSVFEQLRADKYRDTVEVKFISADPRKYGDGIAGVLDKSLIRRYLDEMERRYDLLAESESRNYIQYNHKTDKEKIKLSVLIVDGADAVVGNPMYREFLADLQILTQKSRSSGIRVITFIDELPSGNEDIFKYYGATVSVIRKGFFTKDATNVIIKELYSLGFSPRIDVSYDHEKDTVRIGIITEINGVQLSFTYNYDDYSVNYALLFPFGGELGVDTYMEIFRTLRTDGSRCYDGFSDNYDHGYLAITGSRWASRVTPMLVQCMVDEIFSLRVIDRLKSLGDSEQFCNAT